MKRFLRVTLGVVLVLLLAMSIALADGDDKKSGDFSYRLKGNGTAVITGYDGANEDVYVPRMVDGYTVTEIGENALSSVGQHIITLPDTITVIGDKAFEECKASVIIIPNSVQSIGDFAFQSCSNIQTVSIPASVERIGTGAFAYCSSIRNFYVDSENAVYATIDGVLFNKQKKELVAFSPNREKNSSTYRNGNIYYFVYTVPDGIESIGAYAFAGTEEIGDFKFADTVKTIGDHAFAKVNLSGAKKDHTLKMPTSLEYIDNSAFIGAALGEVVFGSELKVIGDYAFCEAYFYTEEYRSQYNTAKNIILPSSIQSIGKGAFKDFKGSILNFDLSETHITVLEAETFSGVELNTMSLTGKESKISLPPTLKEIKEQAFANVKVHNIQMTSVEIIGKQAFFGGGTKSIVLGNKLKEIGDQAFCYHHFNSQDSLNIPSQVTTIGTNAFMNTTGLKTLSIPASVEKIGDALCDKATVSLKVEKGSYAAQYASENGYQTIDTGNNDTSWLNN